MLPGAFGTVYQGRYKPDDNPLHAQDVAIKTLKGKNVFIQPTKWFIKTALDWKDGRQRKKYDTRTALFFISFFNFAELER